MIGHYRKKPIVIKAVQWLGEQNEEEVLEFCPEAEPNYGTDELGIATLEGEMIASKGDFIIKGVKGEFYPCKPDIFKATYDLVGADKCVFGEHTDQFEQCDECAQWGQCMAEHDKRKREAQNGAELSAGTQK